jgi:hypothetical protein
LLIAGAGSLEAALRRTDYDAPKWNRYWPVFEVFTLNAANCAIDLNAFF